MSEPWGPQQQPYQYGPQPYQQHRPSPPGRPPGFGLWFGLAVVLVIVSVLVIAAVSGDEDDSSSSSAAPTSAAIAPGDGLTAEQRASISAELGYPSEPDAATWAAYIRDLKGIDPDIVHGKEEKAIDRGRNQCRSILDHKGDRAKLIDLTNQRFSSPDHPEGFGLSKASLIFDVVHQHLCPTY